MSPCYPLTSGHVVFGIDKTSLPLARVWTCSQTTFQPVAFSKHTRSIVKVGKQRFFPRPGNDRISLCKLVQLLEIKTRTRSSEMCYETTNFPQQKLVLGLPLLTHKHVNTNERINFTRSKKVIRQTRYHPINNWKRNKKLSFFVWAFVFFLVCHWHFFLFVTGMDLDGNPLIFNLIMLWKYHPSLPSIRFGGKCPSVSWVLEKNPFVLLC